MLKIGVTGGIGSGKSVVCRVFATLGVPVLDADAAARYVIANDASVIAAMKAAFGNDAYIGGQLNRPLISGIVFKDAGQLQQLNAITHPATIAHARRWMEQHRHQPYIIKEAALFFETGSNKDMDVMVGVATPLETRIARVMQRDHISRADVLARMQRQMDEVEKMQRCDYVIANDDQQSVLLQVLQLHERWAQQATA